LFWLMIERFHREGVSLFDFGIGDQIYKRSWCPTETTQHDLILPVSGIGHAAAFAQRGVTRAKAAIKANPQLYGFIQRLRARQGGRDAPAAEAEKD
jgi:CelD/BcsL family acetyltransferase involved in cellulose biosynthesis